MHRTRPSLRIPSARRTKSFDFEDELLDEVMDMNGALTKREHNVNAIQLGSLKPTNHGTCLSSRRLQPIDSAPNVLTSKGKQNSDVDVESADVRYKFQPDSKKPIPLHRHESNEKLEDFSPSSKKKSFASVFRVKSFDIKDDMEDGNDEETSNNDNKMEPAREKDDSSPEPEQVLKNGRIKRKRRSLSDPDAMEIIGGVKGLARIRKKEDDTSSSESDSEQKEYPTIHNFTAERKKKREKQQPRKRFHEQEEEEIPQPPLIKSKITDDQILNMLDRKGKTDTLETPCISYSPRRYSDTASTSDYKCLFKIEKSTDINPLRSSLDPKFLAKLVEKQDEEESNDNDQVTSPVALSNMERARLRLTREPVTYTMDTHLNQTVEASRPRFISNRVG
jgi:hypothetical protein